MQEYVVVDLETTGLDPYRGCEIIEIGITEIKNNQIARNYSRLVKPDAIIPSFITEITGITNKMVENEEGIETVLPRFRKFLSDRVMIAHNAKFDLKFLNYYLQKYNLEPIDNHICTLEMLKECKSYKGKNKKLETACNYYNIINENAHRADSDTKATAELFLIIKDEVFPEPI
ncbi:PolC-type DNA polymerase III [Terrisporobacter glycolicus]|uniref:DNA polymerase III PolC-type n=1 Tax=Terrisporobacter glycolicus ATCC 14880 = DSM 1288 TaxID=1121315 RepID=A0ABZ2ETV8_9FIRM|nr:3'-5' exonuclease [Terrisporobacter glycolicus]